MKEIKAYIHNHRIADVIRALKESRRCDGMRMQIPAAATLASSRCKAC